MNREEFVCSARDRGQQRIPTLPLSASFLLSVYVCLCMAYIPMWHSQPFAATILLLSAMMAGLTLRSPWLIGMIAVPAVLLVTATGSLAVAALPVALLFGTAYGSFLVLNVRSPLLAAIPVAAFLAGALLTGDVGVALLALLPLPAALILAHSLHVGMHRAGAICRVAVAFVIPLLICGAVSVLIHRGGDFFSDLSVLVATARLDLARWLATLQVGSGDDVGHLVLEGMEYALAGTLFNILPGVIMALLAIFAYLADLICLTLFRTYERTRYLSKRVFVFAISLPAAIVFLLGCFLQLMIRSGGGAEAQFAAVVAENLYLALLPAMILVGLLCWIRAFLCSSHRLIWLIASILLLALIPGAVLTVLSVWGAFSVVWSALRKRICRSRTPK